MTTPDSATNVAHTPRTLLKELQEKFPTFGEFKPLAIGIDKQLLARIPELDRKTLRAALGIHTNSLRYMRGMEKATVRFDLDGNPADEVTDEHRAHASKMLKERFRKDAEKRKAQRDADEAKRKQEEAERQHTEKLNQLAAKFSRRS